MPGYDHGQGSLPSYSRPLAAKVGNQRRRLSRPPLRPPAGVPRAITLPVLPVEFSSEGFGAEHDTSVSQSGGFATSAYQEGVTSFETSTSTSWDMLHSGEISRMRVIVVHTDMISLACWCPSRPSPARAESRL